MLDCLKKAGIGKSAGIAAVYTPKDFDLNAIMADIVAIVERGSRRAA
jgi:(2R)-ethylmalonyl-CoA mutase